MSSKRTAKKTIRWRLIFAGNLLSIFGVNLWYDTVSCFFGRIYSLEVPLM
jgi:hypothetical protein